MLLLRELSRVLFFADLGFHVNNYQIKIYTLLKLCGISASILPSAVWGVFQLWLFVIVDRNRSYVLVVKTFFPIYLILTGILTMTELIKLCCALQ